MPHILIFSLTFLFLELEWSWLNFVVTWLKIFKPNDSTKKLSQMVLSQVTGNRSEYDIRRMICGAYPVYARSPSPSQRPAPTTIASRSPFPLGLCSCYGDISEARFMLCIIPTLMVSLLFLLSN